MNVAEAVGTPVLDMEYRFADVLQIRKKGFIKHPCRDQIM